MHFQTPKKVESSSAVTAGILFRFDGGCLGKAVDNFENFFFCEENLFFVFNVRNTYHVRVDVWQDVHLILMHHKLAHLIESAVLAEITPKFELGFVVLLFVVGRPFSARDIDDFFTLIV